MIVGHDQVRQQLEAYLPPVTLLLGPDSVGKWTLAEHLVRHWKVAKADSLFIRKLTAEDARHICRVSGTSPWGPFKCIVLDIDGASEAALNILLKVLEEPPPKLHFILVAARRPMPTIISRATTYTCGLLTDSEVCQVLQQTGMDPMEAARQSPLGQGRVFPALDTEDHGKSRAAVLAVLKAISCRDSDLLARALRRWDDTAHRLLWVWLYEAASGRWRMFSPAESASMGASPAFARRLMGELSRLDHARPRLALQAALETTLVLR